MKVAETKIDATAAKNTPGALRGDQDRPWGPSEGQGGLVRAQGTPCKALPMRSREKRKKGMGYENACLATMPFLCFSRERIAIVPTIQTNIS